MFLGSRALPVLYRHLWADCPDNVGSLTSHGLLRAGIALLQTRVYCRDCVSCARQCEVDCVVPISIIRHSSSKYEREEYVCQTCPLNNIVPTHGGGGGLGSHALSHGPSSWLRTAVLKRPTCSHLNDPYKTTCHSFERTVAWWLCGQSQGDALDKTTAFVTAQSVCSHADQWQSELYTPP
jgi:hypothetical protein